MNYSQALLTDLKASKDGISDYRTAQLLGCSKQMISMIQNGKKPIPKKMAIKLAELAGINPEIVLIRLLIDTAESDEMRMILEGIEDKINLTKH